MKIDDFLTKILHRSLGAWRHRPFPTKFASNILSALRSEVTFEQGTGKTLFVHVKQVERGDNPFREDFSIRFHLSSDPPKWEPGTVETTDVPIGVTEVISSEAAPDADFFFRFNKARSLSQNIERLRRSVENHLSRADLARMFTDHPAAIVPPSELLSVAKPTSVPLHETLD